MSQFIRSVRIGKDYTIEADFNIFFDALQRYCASDSKHDNQQAPQLRTA